VVASLHLETAALSVAKELVASESQLWLLKQAHELRHMHLGVASTWRNCNEISPGHGIPYKVVTDYVDTCAVCQKVRNGLKDTLVPIYRSVVPPSDIRRIGVDTLAMSPEDKEGYNNIVVLMDLEPRYVSLYPRKDKEADSMAAVLMSYVARFGLFDELQSDPGSDIMSAAVKQLMSWLGPTVRISLVDRHESNGVEPTNGQVKRYLTSVIADIRLHENKDLSTKWASSYIMDLVAFHLNDFLSSETGVRPFDAVFGTRVGSYFRLPGPIVKRSNTPAFVAQLDSILSAIRHFSEKHRHIVHAKRAKGMAVLITSRYKT
jgi:hypothetical protein